MTKTPKETIDTKEFKLFEKMEMEKEERIKRLRDETSNLVQELMDMEKYPNNGHSSKGIMAAYEGLVKEFGFEDVQQYLEVSALSTGFAQAHNAGKLGYFLQAEYEELRRTSMEKYIPGSGKELDIFYERCINGDSPKGDGSGPVPSFLEKRA